MRIFVIGYNVEHFLEKAEDIIQSIWGINKPDNNNTDIGSENTETQ